MFQVGDKVAHPMHGAGIIDSIVQKKIDGVIQDYYIMKLPNRSMVVMIPVDNTDQIGIRPIVDQEKANQVLQAIPQLKVEMNSNWNRRYRENLERMKSGDLLEVACVIRGLTDRDNKRGLSTGERKMLHAARQILISEIVLSKDESYEDVEAELDRVLA